MIDTAWAAVLLNWSTIAQTTLARRIDGIKRKECTLLAFGPYFFFFFAVFFFAAVFFAFFAFIVCPSIQ